MSVANNNCLTIDFVTSSTDKVYIPVDILYDLVSSKAVILTETYGHIGSRESVLHEGPI